MSVSDPGTLRVERRQAIAILTLSNPSKRNALDPVMLDGLTAAIDQLAAEGARAAVLTGEGAVFSSGYDITALPTTGAPASDNALARALTALEEGPLPVVAALPGPAVGGGCELACACDLRVAHPGVTLGMPPVRLGILYAASGLERFVALIGSARTRELFLTGARIDASRAHSWGLVDHLVPELQVLSLAIDLAEQIAKGAPLAIRATRQALALITHGLGPAARAQLATLERQTWESEDAAEGRRAFVEKRPPVFRGR